MAPPHDADVFVGEEAGVTHLRMPRQHIVEHEAEASGHELPDRIPAGMVVYIESDPWPALLKSAQQRWHDHRLDDLPHAEPVPSIRQLRTKPDSRARLDRKCCSAWQTAT